MSDPNDQDDLNVTDADLDSMMDRLEQLDPTKLTDMKPEQVEGLLGGAKLGDVMAAFQQRAREMAAELAEQQGVDLDQLDDDEDDGWFDHDEALQDDSLNDLLFARPSEPDGSLDDYPGSEQIWQAACKLEKDFRLQVSVEIKSPPVTAIEKIYYSTCHYRLVLDPFDTKVTFRDVTTPRQDYLQGNGWPAMLSLPRRSWPDMEVLLDTIQVEQFNLREAIQTNRHNTITRDDLIPFAKQAINAAMNGDQ